MNISDCVHLKSIISTNIKHSFCSRTIPYYSLLTDPPLVLIIWTATQSYHYSAHDDMTKRLR